METAIGPGAWVTVYSIDGDPTIWEGDWLRLWSSEGAGIAHDVWVGKTDVVYENSGPGGCVRQNSLSKVLAGRKIVWIMARTAPADLTAKIAFAESRLGACWSAFYNCQDLASEIATGRAQSSQRDAATVALALVGLLACLGTHESKFRRSRCRA